jgi:nickel-dependent lactate racemase
MEFKLPYGKKSIPIEIDDNYHPYLLQEKPSKDLKDPGEALRHGLQHPLGTPALRDFAGGSDKIGILINDITRPTPTSYILPYILAELAHIKSENITLFIATGTHRASTPLEIEQILGSSIASKYRVIQNDARDASQYTHLGKTQFGHEILIHSEVVACDTLVSIGFIEPHFFAGFSGGMKNILPGMASIKTAMGNHSAEMIDNPNATWGVTDGNPIWEEIHSVREHFPRLFLVNVTLNEEKEIKHSFCGEPDRAYRAGCESVKDTAMAAVPHPFDVVVTTNSGYPLDINLYQTVKGMSTAAQIIKPGGDIIVFSECPDGIPEHGCYGELLAGANSADDLLRQIYASEEPIPDQWQAQIQAKILKKANVHLYSQNLTDVQISSCLLNPFRDFDQLLSEIIADKGEGLSICVAPRGPLVVPYIN